MKKMKLSHKLWLAALSLFVAIMLGYPVILMAANPIRRPSFIIERYILRQTPPGMYIDDVAKIVEGLVENNDDWGGGSVNRERGFVTTPLR